jgi:hypothetical protein
MTSQFFTELWQMLIGRIEGPFTFRLALQPIVAGVLAARAALRDARGNRQPFLASAFSSPDLRAGLIQEAWKELRTVFVVAVVVDLIYQLIRFGWIYPGQAVICATVLAIFPYLLIRGPLNRLASKIPGIRFVESKKTPHQI